MWVLYGKVERAQAEETKTNGDLAWLCRLFPIWTLKSFKILKNLKFLVFKDKICFKTLLEDDSCQFPNTLYGSFTNIQAACCLIEEIKRDLCSCLENPRDGGACGLPSTGWHRVGHDWCDLAAAASKSWEWSWLTVCKYMGPQSWKSKKLNSANNQWTCKRTWVSTHIATPADISISAL